MAVMALGVYRRLQAGIILGVMLLCCWQNGRNRIKGE
jgi:hypothetical protein